MQVQGKNLDNSVLKRHQAWCLFKDGQRSISMLVLMLFLASALSGCGFHLRGYGSAQAAQFKTLKLTGLENVTPQIQRALKAQFEASGVTLVTSLASAELDLKLQRTYNNQSNTSYTGTGDVASILINIKQAFTVEVVATETVLMSSDAVAYRDHQIDNANRLASNRELQEIQQQMANRIAAQILDQINRQLRALKSTNDPAP